MKLPTLLLLATPALGQGVLHVYNMPTDLGYGPMFRQVDGRGDVDGDGVRDMLIGVHQHLMTGEGGGYLVLSGATGGVITGATLPGVDFGHSIAQIGDANGDGFGDIVVCAPLDDLEGPDTGTVRVLSPATGQRLGQFSGGGYPAITGIASSGLGDLDGDGHRDFAIYAYFNSGSRGLEVRSGATPSQVIHQIVALGSQWLGWRLAGGADFNGDGVPEVLAARRSHSSLPNHEHLVSIIDGAAGSEWRLHWGQDGSRYGWAMSSLSDLDADGCPDLLISAPSEDGAHLNEGAVYVVSGATGLSLRTHRGTKKNAYFGSAVDAGGDFDSDGVEDYLVMSTEKWMQTRFGKVYVYSGRTGELLYWTGPTDQGSLASMTSLGDVDGDGYPDFATVGNNSLAGATRATIFSGFSEIGERYCHPANANSTGATGRMVVRGHPSVVQDWLQLEAHDLPPLELGYFVLSQTQGFVPNVGGTEGNLCLGGLVLRLRSVAENSGGHGRIETRISPLDLPGGMGALMPGETWNFQGWYRDGATSNFTDAVGVSFE